MGNDLIWCLGCQCFRCACNFEPNPFTIERITAGKQDKESRLTKDANSCCLEVIARSEFKRVIDFGRPSKMFSNLTNNRLVAGTVGQKRSKQFFHCA